MRIIGQTNIPIFVSRCNSLKSVIGEPLGMEGLLKYLEFCRKQVEKKVTSVDTDTPSGFHWLPFSKMELQFYNIRHLQHHVGVLCDRLQNRENVESTG